MPQGSPQPLGYEVPIRMGTWQRLLVCGVPQKYFYAWLVGCLWFGLMALMYVGLWWALGMAGAWLLGQALLMGLTYWNVNWDSALLARWKRKYQPYYRAG